MKSIIALLVAFSTVSAFAAERKCGYAPRSDIRYTHDFIDENGARWTVLNITLVSDSNYCITGDFDSSDMSVVSKSAQRN